MILKILLTLAFLAVMVGIGIYSRKHSQSVDGFVLGGRNVGPWLTAFAYGTSYFSAVVFVGYAGQFGWKYGLSSTWIGIGNAIIGSMLAWLVLARRTRLMTQHIQSRTMPDFFGTRFNSENLRIVASIIAFVFLIPYTAGVYMGISKLFELGFGSAVPYEFWACLMAALTAVYVILGGYKATAINDFIQGIIMLFGITAVIGMILHSQGGLCEAVNKLAAIAPNADDLTQRGAALYANFKAGDFASWFGPAKMSLLGVVILTSLGTWGLPQMVGKFYSITDASAIRRGTVISTLFALVVSGGCYFMGGFGRLFLPTAFNAEKGKFVFDTIVPQMLTGLPEALMALVMLLVLSASMSTLASLVLTSSSTMTLDLIYRDKKSVNGEVAAGQIDDEVALSIERRKVVVMRVLIVFFIVISLLIALRPPQFIAQLMGISWGALAGAFLAPFMLGLYWKGVTRASVWASFVWGVGLTVVNMALGNPINPIDCGALAMLGGFAVVFLVSLISPKLPAAYVAQIFTCYGKKYPMDQLRHDIDAADDAIALALKRRFALTDEMHAIKDALKLPPVDPIREKAIVTRMLEMTPSAHRDVVYSIYERIFGGSRGLVEVIARGVCIVDGKVLLCRSRPSRSARDLTSTSLPSRSARDLTSTSLPPCYLPGGHVEFGEKGAEALVREIQEELGAQSTAGDFLGIDENSFVQSGKPHSEVNLVYSLTLAKPLPDPKACEDHIEFLWVPLKDLASANVLPKSILRYVKA